MDICIRGLISDWEVVNRMDEQEVRNEYDMLRGSINRMFLTDDAAELYVMYEFARKRIERIYDYGCVNKSL